MIKLIKATLLTQEAFREYLPITPTRFGIRKFYSEGMHEIDLIPDGSLTSYFMHHKANVGVWKTGQWHIPIGVAAYPWFLKDKSVLEKAGRLKLTLVTLLTAWAIPLFNNGHIYYQLKQAVAVTLIITLVQPLYESGWQIKRLFLKLTTS